MKRDLPELLDNRSLGALPLWLIWYQLTPLSRWILAAQVSQQFGSKPRICIFNHFAELGEGKEARRGVFLRAGDEWNYKTCDILPGYYVLKTFSPREEHQSLKKRSVRSIKARGLLNTINIKVSTSSWNQSKIVSKQNNLFRSSKFTRAGLLAAN